MQDKLYRDNGAIGALLDEYEKATNELIALVSTVTQEELVFIVDSVTKDKDCKSISTILAHVVVAGKYYVEAIRVHLGEAIDYSEKTTYASVPEYLSKLHEMFACNVQFFQDHPEVQLEEFDSTKKVLTRWGQRYDIEQLYEHAIVHILRHRRQIERFLLKLRIEKL